MAQSDDLQFIISVVDQATDNIKKIQDEVTTLTSKVTESSDKAQESSLSFNKLAGAFAVGELAAEAFHKAIEFGTETIKSSIEAYAQHAQVMAQTAAVIKSTGETAGFTVGAITEMAKEIQKTTPINDDAAQSGMNMLLTFRQIGHDIFPQVTQAMIDTATAMNGGITPSSSQLIDTAKQLGFALNDPVEGMTRLRREGVTFTQAQMDLVKELESTGRGVEAQKILINELSAEFGGSATAAAHTLGGEMDMLKNNMEDVQKEIGSALAPGLTILIQAMSDTANEADQRMNPSLNNTAVFFAKVATFAAEAGSLVKMVGKDIISTIGDIGAAANAFFHGDILLNSVGHDNSIANNFQEFQNETQKAADNLQKTINQIQTKGLDSFNADGFKQQLAQIPSMIDQTGQKIQKELQKIADDMQKENESFAHSLDLRTATYQQNLTDLVTKHRDAIKSLQTEMKSLEDDFNSANSDRSDTHDSRVNDINQKYADETQNLKDNLNRRLSDSHNSDQQIIKFFQAQIDTKEKARQDELTKEQDAYNKEQQKALDAYNKQKSDLQTQLDAELKIEHDHQADFDAVKDTAAQDDITRMEQSFQNELTEMKYQHNIRMQELKKEQDEILAVKSATNSAAAASVTSSAVNRGVSAAPAPKTQSFTAASRAPSPAYVVPSSPTTKNGSVTINQNNTILNQLDLNASLKSLGFALGG